MPRPSASRLEITLAGMQFHVRVGVLPHERELAQPLEVDLTVRRAANDSAVLDYRALYAIVAGVIGVEPLEYLESIGTDIAARAMALPGVSGVRVAVRKPHVMLAGPLAHAEIVVEQGS
jgi:dihydroneopterin aldolase